MDCIAGRHALINLLAPEFYI